MIVVLTVAWKYREHNKVTNLLAKLWFWRYISLRSNTKVFSVFQNIHHWGTFILFHTQPAAPTDGRLECAARYLGPINIPFFLGSIYLSLNCGACGWRKWTIPTTVSTSHQVHSHLRAHFRRVLTLLLWIHGKTNVHPQTVQLHLMLNHLSYFLETAPCCRSVINLHANQ